MPTLDPTAAPSAWRRWLRLAPIRPGGGGWTAELAVMLAIARPLPQIRELVSAEPERPSDAFRLAQPWDPAQLLVARALGAEWLDEYAEKWRRVTLEITGEDLIAGRCPRGPGDRARPRGGTLRQARRRALRPRGGTADRTGRRPRGASRGVTHLACLAWNGASETEFAGSRRSSTGRGRPSRRAIGGVSEAPYDALNVAIMTGDERERVRENRHRLAAGLGRDPDGVVMGRQVHGAELREHRGPQEPRVFADVRPEPGGGRRPQRSPSAELTPLVMVADCLPVAMVRARRSRDGALRLARPGRRDRRRGGGRAVDADVRPRRAGHRFLLLRGRRRGARGVRGSRRRGRGQHARPAGGGPPGCSPRAGVTAIESADLCTSCNPDLFYSHRRDGERTGRQAGLVWMD